MEYRNLGDTGLFLSAFSFGSWVTFHNQVNLNSAKDLMAQAFDAGVNFFDNAEVYADGESEIIMGQTLKELKRPRDSYCVSSKVFWGGEHPTQKGLNRKHIVDACNNALTRLQVDYLDLYYCHRADLDTPILETVRAMDTLVKQGKILYWGTSEWDAAQIIEAYRLAEKYHLTPPSMEQPQYNLLHREKVEKEFTYLYENMGLGTTIWSPLCSGVLTGKYNNGIPDGSRLSLENFSWLKEQFETHEGKAKIEKARKLENIAKEIGISLTHLSLAWCLKNPNVSSVILGATNKKQLSENLKALDSLELLTPEIINRIEEVVANRPAADIDWKNH